MKKRKADRGLNTEKKNKSNQDLGLNNNLNTNNMAKNKQNNNESVQKKESIAVISTTKGDIEIKLFDSLAPKTVENFVGLANKGYYDGVIFHRVIPDFMIQSGDPTGTGMGGESLWGGKFDDEFDTSLTNKIGGISMANAGKNTNGSQFFIVQKDAHWLDGKHSVFGEVISGMEVVDEIANAERDAMDKPLSEISMKSVSIK